MSRPSGSVLKRRVSTVSAGVTRSDGIRPVFVSTRKSAKTPRICPSSVMTVLPRSSVAKTFIPAAARILRCLFFLSGLRRCDVDAKPSESRPNEVSELTTSLSYTAGGVASPLIGGSRHGQSHRRTARVRRPRHLRGRGVQSRDERLPGREPGYPDHEAAPPRGDRPSRRVSAADRGPQTELGEPRQR